VHPELYRKIDPIVRDDPRFQREAYEFVWHALERTIQELHGGGRRGTETHVTPEQLLEGIRALALEEFGLLARSVLASWGVHRTEDLGEIVFNMVDHELLSRQETDTREGFRDGYDFETVFEKEYEIPVTWDGNSD